MTLSARQQADLDLIAVGAMSPLDGFMGREAYESVITGMRLPSGLAWSVPVTLAVQPDELASRSARRTEVEVELVDDYGRFLGVLEVTDRYETDPVREARLVYGTEEDAHPGVASLYAHGTTGLAGPVRGGRAPADRPRARSPSCSTRAPRAPSSTRAAGRPSSASRPATRSTAPTSTSPRCALETVDGLLLHPLVGETKSDDIPADVRMRCYEVLHRGLLPEGARGARRASRRPCATPDRARPCFHAILRQNYGCTHFIVGRDHAGVGNYYGTYDAHRVFDDISRDELAIQPVFFEHSFWCNLTGGMATTKTSPSSPEQRVFLSGTKVREMLDRGEIPPVEFTRPEVGEDPDRGLRATA